MFDMLGCRGDGSEFPVDIGLSSSRAANRSKASQECDDPREADKCGCGRGQRGQIAESGEIGMKVGPE